MRPRQNHSAKIVLPLIIIGLGIALLLLLIPGEPRPMNDKLVPDSEITDLGQNSKAINNDTYHRTFRTLLADPLDNKEKVIELRYSSENVLMNVLIDDKIIPLADFGKNIDLLVKALSEELEMREETSDLRNELMNVLNDAGIKDLQNFGDQIERILEQLNSDTDRETREMETMKNKKPQEHESSLKIEK